MKRYFGIIVAIIGVGASIVWTMRRFDQKAAEASREKNEQRLKIEYMERAAWVRSTPDEKGYRDEIGNLFNWYFKELTEHQNRFNLNRKNDDYLQELEERGKKTVATKYEEGTRDKTEEKRAVYEYTRKVFDQFTGRTYSPYWTATDKGIRLDIVSADTRRIDGEEKIHLPVVLWGFPRDERTDEHGVKRVTSSAAFRFNWRLLDEKGKLIAEIPGEGGPNKRVDWPERYVKFFPQGALLGEYDIDKLPQQAKTAEIAFTVTGRSPTGGEINLSYLWKLDVPAAWKLGAGETWKNATESVRPEDEIDPSKKKK